MSLQRTQQLTAHLLGLVAGGFDAKMAQGFFLPSPHFSLKLGGRTLDKHPLPRRERGGTCVRRIDQQLRLWLLSMVCPMGKVLPINPQSVCQGVDIGDHRIIRAIPHQVLDTLFEAR